MTNIRLEMQDICLKNLGGCYEIFSFIEKFICDEAK